MKRKTPTPAAIRAALAAQSLRTSRRWLVQFPEHETERTYQEAVDLNRVLAEHRAASAAAALEHGADPAVVARLALEAHEACRAARANAGGAK